MGSVGKGRFEDYSTQSGNDKCLDDIEDVRLDDVARSEYFKQYNQVPAIITSVELQKELYYGRIAVINNEKHIIGFLPTNYNYLLSCLNNNYKYTGNISYSSNKPFPIIVVSLNATK